MNEENQNDKKLISFRIDAEVANKFKSNCYYFGKKMSDVIEILINSYNEQALEKIKAEGDSDENQGS